MRFSLKTYLQNMHMHHYQKSKVVEWEKFWTGGQNMWVQVLALPPKTGTSYESSCSLLIYKMS